MLLKNERIGLKKVEVPIVTVYCHRLQVDDDGYIKKVLYSRQKGKHEIVERYSLSLENSIAMGDAFNDFTMLKAVSQGYLFSPSKDVLDKSPPAFNVVNNYQEVINSIDTIDIFRQSHRYKLRNF